MLKRDRLADCRAYRATEQRRSKKLRSSNVTPIRGALSGFTRTTSLTMRSMSVARTGAYVEFDGIGSKTANWHQQCIEAMARRELLDRVLISQDAGWYHVGEPNGGDFRGYDYIYREFLPRLPADWRTKLMTDNPARAFPG